MTLAVRSVFSPRIGLSLAFSRPWSHSTRLFSYWRCYATRPESGSRSRRYGRRPVGDHLGRFAVEGQGCGEERARRGDVATLRHVHVDHLPALVHGPIHVPPYPGDLDVGFVDEPAIPCQVPRGPGCRDQQPREPLHPPVEDHVVDLDAALGEEFFEVPGGQPLAQVPAHHQQDHFRRESETGELRCPPADRGRRVRFIAPPSPPQCDPSTQQSPRRTLGPGSAPRRAPL